MTSFVEQIKEAFNTGDPVVGEWFLVRQSYLPFTICAMYLLFATVIGPWIMENKRPMKLRFLMVFFNFCIVGIYTGCLLLIFWNLQFVKLEQFCKEGKVKIGDVTYTQIRILWVLYVIKYVEFLDTIFFILRKKKNQLTVLHIMHHTLVPLLGWVILKTERSGFQSVVAIINGITHIIMYTYYGLSAIGPQCRKYLWWKRHITELQMVQFVLIIVYVAVVAPLFNCSTGIFTFIMEIFMIPLFLYLFYKFYKAHFKSDKASYDKYVIINGDV